MVVQTVLSFSIHAGEALPREPYLRAWESREGLGTLYAMVEVLSGPPRQVVDIVWDGVEEALHDPRLTVTRYLQSALLRAHQTLRQYSGRGWSAGATLVSVRENDIYIAWAGPSFAYLLAGGHFVRPSAASEQVRGKSTALGDPKEPVLHVAREALSEGDIFVMGWTNLRQMTSDTALAALMATGLENTAQSLYRLISGGKDSAVLVMGFEGKNNKKAG